MVFTLTRNEITKMVRTKLLYFGIAAAVVLCFLIFTVAEGVLGAEQLNGWGYVSHSMQMVFSDIGLLFIVVFAAMLIAEETGSGTIRPVLSNAVLRREFYIAKVLTGMIYALAVSLSSLVMSIFLAALRYDFKAVSDTAGLIYSRKEVAGSFFLALFLSWLPLASAVIYGIFISTIIRKAGQAVAVAVGALYLIDFTKHLLGIENWIFLRYVGLPWAIFHQMAQGVDYQWSPPIWRMTGVTIVSSAVMFAAGLIIFYREDLNG